MPRVRQLPEVYLRGSLSNETMKHLPPHKKDHVDKVLDTILRHPSLEGHKNKFIEKLGATIGGDYFDDRSTAFQEYRIIVWRATAHLLYHADYSYSCSNCKNNSYTSQRGKETVFNQRYEICPNCNHIAVDDPGDSGLKPGMFVEFDQYLVLIDTDDEKPPTKKSCIMPIIGKPKIEDPFKIINDPDQVRKYYGQFIWNYFRQIINENEITHHGKQSRMETGPADCLTISAIISLLRDFDVDFHYDYKNPCDGVYCIVCNAHTSSIDFTLRFCEIIHSANTQCGDVVVETDHTSIRVKDLAGDSPLIDLEVSARETVLVVGKTTEKGDGDEDLDLIEQIPEQTMFEDSIQNFESNERLQIIRDSLPDGDCQAVFDLYVGNNDLFDEFVASDPRAVQLSNGVPRQNKIAQFLGTTTKEVKRHQEIIGLQMLNFGLVAAQF